MCLSGTHVIMLRLSTVRNTGLEPATLSGTRGEATAIFEPVMKQRGFLPRRRAFVELLVPAMGRASVPMTLHQVPIAMAPSRCLWLWLSTGRFMLPSEYWAGWLLGGSPLLKV
jgi:hypothetical protein